MELSFLYLHFPTASLSPNMKTMMVFQLLSVKTKGLLGQRVMRMGFEGSQPAHEKDRGEKIDPKILIQTEVMGLGNDCTVNIAPPYHTIILMSN